MYLSDIIILNYRSCRNLHLRFQPDQPNVLIGINDSGKSTILRAVGLLLETKPKFNFLTEDKQKNDVSNTCALADEQHMLFDQLGLPRLDCPEGECVITGGFVLEPRDFKRLEEQEFSNHLLWTVEQMQARQKDGQPVKLWLARRFDRASQKAVHLLLTPEAVDDGQPGKLYYLPQTRLVKLRDVYGISNKEIRNENQSGPFSNLDVLRAIYKRRQLCDQWIEYQGDSGFWPMYQYLDWNLSLDQFKEVATDILNSTLAASHDQALGMVREQAKEYERLVNEQLKTLVPHLREVADTVENVKAVISMPVKFQVTDILLNKFNSDGDIHLEAQGEGIKRQLWFALLQWKLRQQPKGTAAGKDMIWCFDEPETHLYPGAQRRFFDLIKAISRSNVQTILSTHSTIFIDRVQLSSLYRVELQEGYSCVSNSNNVDDVFHSLNLRNSDFLFYDTFLVVEGDTEKVLIPHLYQLVTGRTLAEDAVQLISLGGKNKWHANRKVLEDVFNGFRKDVVTSVTYIFDRDAVFDLTEKDFEARNIILVGKQDIEDSLPAQVWLEYVQYYYDGKLDLQVSEIENLQDSIPAADPKKHNMNGNHKFYKRLKGMVRKKAERQGLECDLLPEKGTEEAEVLCRVITDKFQVPQEIHQAFYALVSRERISAAAGQEMRF